MTETEGHARVTEVGDFTQVFRGQLTPTGDYTQNAFVSVIAIAYANNEARLNSFGIASHTGVQELRP